MSIYRIAAPRPPRTHRRRSLSAWRMFDIGRADTMPDRGWRGALRMSLAIFVGAFLWAVIRRPFSSLQHPLFSIGAVPLLWGLFVLRGWWRCRRIARVVFEEREARRGVIPDRECDEDCTFCEGLSCEACGRYTAHQWGKRCSHDWLDRHDTEMNPAAFQAAAHAWFSRSKKGATT